MIKTEKLLNQFGLYKTGTNYLKFLLQENYHVKVLVNRGGWKHDCHNTMPHLDAVISCKNPFSWLLSFFNHSKTTLEFPEFIRNGHVEVWNDKNRCWLNMENRFVFKYESLMSDPELELSKLKIVRKPGEFILPKNKLAATGDGESRQHNKIFDKSFYDDKRFMEMFKKEDIEYVESTLDKEVLHNLGYSFGEWLK